MMSGGKCLCCLSIDHLRNLSKNEWDLFDYMFHPFIENYPDVYNNSDVKLCNSCFTSVQCVDKFRRSALQNFLKLMALLYQNKTSNDCVPVEIKHLESDDLKSYYHKMGSNCGSSNTISIEINPMKEEKTNLMTTEIKNEIHEETGNLMSTEIKEVTNAVKLEIEICEENTPHVINNTSTGHSSSPVNNITANPMIVNPGLNFMTVLPNFMVASNPRMTAANSTLAITNPAMPSFILELDASSAHNNLKSVAPNPLTSQIQREKPKQLDGPHYCEPCGITLKNLRSFKRHNDMKHTGQKMYCEQCDKWFRGESFKRHFKWSKTHNKEKASEEDAPQYCEPCGRTLKNLQSLRRHNNMKHKGERKYCEECDKWFSEGFFKVHLKMSKVHNKDKAEINRKGKELCPVCKKSIVNLKTHMQAHGGSVYCAPCDKWFAPVSYKAHIKYSSKHGDDVKAFRFICDYCGSRFCNRPAIRTHIFSKHLNIKSHKCPKCPKSYFTSWAMKRHVVVHHEKLQPARTHICEVCGAGFRKRTLLSAHMVTHTGARPYSCDICGDTFGYSGALYTHKKLKHKVKHRKTPGQEENIAEDNKDTTIENEKNIKEIDTVAAVKGS